MRCEAGGATELLSAAFIALAGDEGQLCGFSADSRVSVYQTPQNLPATALEQKARTRLGARFGHRDQRRKLGILSLLFQQSMSTVSSRWHTMQW